MEHEATNDGRHDCSAVALLTERERAFVDDQLRPAVNAIAVVERIVCERTAPIQAGLVGAMIDVVIDAIEETFLAQLPSAAMALCAREDVNAGLDALRERFRTPEWQAGQRP